MEPSDKPLTYEEARMKRIEANKRRMEELGLKEQAKLFKKVPQSRPRKIRAKPEALFVETRRSQRVAGAPKVDYKETQTLPLGERYSRGVGKVLRRGYMAPAARTEAAMRASDVMTEHPSFVKAMLKSHVSGGFWLGLPSQFCSENFTKDELIILEDEGGMEWETIYLHQKHGLSGGWRGFSIDHELVDGDAVVFELVTQTRFKVQIKRASDTSEDGEAKEEESAMKKKSFRFVLKENQHNDHVHSVVHKMLKREKQDVETPTPSKRVKTILKNRRRNASESSEESASSESERESEPGERDFGETSELEGAEDSGPAELSDKEDEETAVGSGGTRANRSSPRKRVKQSNEAAAGSTSDEVSHDNSRGGKDQVQRSAKTRRKNEVKAKQSSRAGKPQQKEKREISTNRKKMIKRPENFVRRVEKKAEVQVCNRDGGLSGTKADGLPQGVRRKPVAVCSISREHLGSSSRKVPALNFRSRKYSFFSPLKSLVKVL